MGVLLYAGRSQFPNPGLGFADKVMPLLAPWSRGRFSFFEQLLHYVKQWEDLVGAHDELVSSVRNVLSLGQIPNWFAVRQHAQEILPGDIAPKALKTLTRLEQWVANEQKRSRVHPPQQCIQHLLTVVRTFHPYTANHQQRVAAYSQIIATALDLDDTVVDRICAAAKVHDVGKLGIYFDLWMDGRDWGSIARDEMLEREAHMQSHSEIGATLLRSSNVELEIAVAVLRHHEDWDGNGYPGGQKGDAISLEARVLRAADSYDAMTAHRGISGFTVEWDEAIKKLRSQSEKQLDPQICSILAQCSEELGKALNEFRIQHPTDLI